ncbi:hypothetical protein RR46_00394 [Papilio xuthus]|uniref:Uncharacterized protein n=1 Tax=Papilio xuthus TaxID=66420 RepID=A0A0N1PGK8_PAPXU|nr:hypothetical protein RR46_00394 [Papilio xuthus]
MLLMTSNITPPQAKRTLFFTTRPDLVTYTPLQTAEVKGRVRSPHFCRTAQQFVEQSAPARAVKGAAILCSRADCVGAIFIAPAI